MKLPFLNTAQCALFRLVNSISYIYVSVLGSLKIVHFKVLTEVKKWPKMTESKEYIITNSNKNQKTIWGGPNIKPWKGKNNNDK